MKIASASVFLEEAALLGAQIALLVGLNAPIPIRTLSRPQAVAPQVQVIVAARKTKRANCRTDFIR
ncbi:MAG: hypothetical protein ACREP3_14640 [Candidatus Binatia bacterium]